MSRRLMDVADLPDYSGNPNSPWADDWDADEAAPTMSHREVITLAGQGDIDALAIIDSCVECNSEMLGFQEATEEELAEWYEDFRTGAVARPVYPA